MEFLSIFTPGELVAITMVVLQLILATVLLRDKCLWRIHPSAARGQLEGQSTVHGPRRSAGKALPHGSAPGSSLSSRRRLPRFIRSCRDSQALFEEQRRELQAQLAQWRWGRGSGRVLHADLHAKPRLLGARERPQCLGVELARPDVNEVTKEDKRENMRQWSSDSSTTELERRRSVAIARLLPRLVVIMNPIVLESSCSSCSSSSVESSSSTVAGRLLGQLRARLQRHLEAWHSRRAQRRRLGTRLVAQWWQRCWARLRKGCRKNE